MQEDIEQRTIALSVNATKLTGRTLAKVLSAALRQIQRGHQKRQTPQGRQSVKKLMNHGIATNSLNLSGNTRLFDRVARKYNVDYAIHKTGPDKYLLFFKSGQADAITACFDEYTKRVLNRGKSKRPSILKQLQTLPTRSAPNRASMNENGRRCRMNDNIRKYVISHVPYLFILWFGLKLGTAYRLATGATFGEKLIGMMNTIGPAFETLAPGFVVSDWLIGLAVTVMIRLIVWHKVKKAKKFRKDVEYGSARWGTTKDINPFIDPKFQNNVILTGTEFLTMNTRPANPANARNLNCCVIGSSGSGKTRFWLTPQLLQAHSSYVVVDPKGGILGQVGAFLQKQGYKIKVFNSIDFSNSMLYNPLAYIKTENDILKFVNALIENNKGDGKEGDPFWTKAETLLYCALIGYIVFEAPEEERNLNTLVDMLNSMETREDDEDFKNAVDYMFMGLEKRSPNHFAVRQYKKFKLASGKTFKSILISCGARLAPFDIEQLREMMSDDEMELDRMGDRKTATFFIISDTNTTYNFIVALAFSQMFNLLCERADNKHGGRLPHHVRVLWDEAAIPDKCRNWKSWWR